jgi:4-amino-4-deoxy-L-arabinose transferase-like glycosyltransferase
MLRKIHRFWEEERNLLVLLVILIVHMFIIIPFGQEVLITRIIAALFYCFILLAAWKYLNQNTRWGKVLIIATIGIILLLAIGTFRKEEWVVVLSNFSIILYCVVLAWIVLLKTFSEGPITIYRIEGSIVVYLLFGLIFANTYDSCFISILLFHSKEYQPATSKNFNISVLFHLPQWDMETLHPRFRYRDRSPI